MIFKAVLAAIVLLSSQAFADALVSCKDQKSTNGAIVFSYTLKSTASRRLASDISYVSRTSGATIISSLQVAQFVAANNSLYMMIDDVSEMPTLIFGADPRPAYGFSATLRELINGKWYSRGLKCTLKQI